MSGSDPTLTETDPDAATVASAGEVGTIGRFVVLEKLGMGGMGLVLAAYDPELDRRVALKLLRPDRLGGAAARARLQREAQAMARLVHPHVVTVFEVGSVGEQVFIAMEFVDGETLRSWLGREERAWPDVVEVFLAAGRGLAAAHDAGVVHRDFKPDNVLVGRDGRVRVSDFGVASTGSRSLDSVDPASWPSPGLLQELTVHGMVVGTPAYMAPEQHDGAEVDARADQFAFCVALYEALHGERPFAGDSYAQLIAAVRDGRVRPPASGRTVPAWLREVVLRGLRVRPEERHASMHALLRALERDPARRRRRALVVGSVAAALALLVGGLAWQHATRGALCGETGAQLAGIWDAPARQRLAEAFRATGVAYAGETGERVGAALDRYARAWAAMRTDACRATRVRGEQSEALLDLRMACLDRRRAGLAALVDVLAAADASVVERAVLAASGLPPVEDCGDTEALLARVPLPRDAAAARHVADLDARLEKVSALRAAGKYTEALALATPLAAEADATGYAPVRARAHDLLGLVHTFLDDGPAAERELRLAAELAAESRDDAQLATSLARLAIAYSDPRQEYREAVVAARMAQLANRRGGGDVLRQAEAQRAESIALGHLGQVKESLALAEAAYAAFERTLGKDDPRLVPILVSLLLAGLDAGRFEDARTWGDRALALAERAYGPDHPVVASVLSNLGLLARAQGKHADQLAFHRRALAIQEKIYGPEHPKAVGALYSVGVATAVLGDTDGAAAIFERVLAIRERTLGPEHAETGAILGALGRIRTAQRRFDEAQGLLERALAVRKKIYGPDSQHLAVSYDALTIFFYDRGMFEEARGYARLGLETRRKSQGPEHAEYGEGLLDMGEIEVADGRCSEARPYLQQGIAVLEKAVGKDNQKLARGLRFLAVCSPPAAAVALLERALAIVEKAQVAEGQVGLTRFYLARALWDRGERGRARELAARAEEQLGKDSYHVADLAELRAWRARHR